MNYNLDEAKETICKWYKKLNFPDNFDNEFAEAVNHFNLPEANDIREYNIDDEKRIENLLVYLYFCEALEEKYKEKNISEEVLLDTLSDIVIWTNTNYSLTDTFGLCEASWLKKHLSLQLFRLGRLQFAFGKCKADIEEIGANKGDDIIEVHIPEGNGLNYEQCKQAFEYAEKFFKEYFPEYDYKCFTCHSWLLDDTLKNHMREDSNILKFQSFYTNVFADESFAILKYTFSWDASIDKLNELEPKTSLAKKVKEHIQNGGKFYQTYGYVKRV